MRRIRPEEAEVCNEFSMLLGLEECSGGCIDVEAQSSKCVCKRQNNAQFVQQIGVVQGDGGLRNEERCCSNGTVIQEG